ncbi:MAG TPA: PP2C family serine/threonine-protein phosphatase [Acidobacteriaceae bacterium]|jgi:protein phosphatase
MANAATLKSAKPQIPPAPAVAATFLSASAPSSLRTFAMLSHPGRVRHSNQDACASLPELGAFVVCDGIGGAAAGEVASRLATEVFLSTLSQPDPQQSRRIPPKSASGPNGDKAASHHSLLHEAVRAANQAVYRHSRKSPAFHGMGTTLVAALLDATSPTLWLAHVGDSRCYRLRSAKLEGLTVDHSLVEEQIRAGLLSRVQASHSPIRNIITRAIGSQPAVEPDIAAHDVQSGDLYLLASDGLTRELTDSEIAQILAPTRTFTPADLEAACQTLVDAANRKGGRDNITVLLIACR